MKALNVALVLCLMVAIGQSMSQAMKARFSGSGTEPKSPNARGQQPRIDPSKEADIRRLMVLTNTTLLSKDTIAAMEANVRPAITSAMPPGDYRQKLVDLFVAKYQSKLNPEVLKDRAIPIYDKHFSAADIKEMIRFYQTSLGQKIVKEMPAVTAELQQAAQAWGEAIGKESMTEVLAEHPDLAKEFEAASRKTKP